jgi:hypothetical protein
MARRLRELVAIWRELGVWLEFSLAKFLRLSRFSRTLG